MGKAKKAAKSVVKTVTRLPKKLISNTRDVLAGGEDLIKGDFKGVKDRAKNIEDTEKDLLAAADDLRRGDLKGVSDRLSTSKAKAPTLGEDDPYKRHVRVTGEEKRQRNLGDRGQRVRKNLNKIKTVLSSR